MRLMTIHEKINARSHYRAFKLAQMPALRRALFRMETSEMLTMSYRSLGLSLSRIVKVPMS